MKCIGCKKPIPEGEAYMTVPGSKHCGPRGMFRKPSVNWCEPCWSENVRFNDRSRAESDARNAAILKSRGL